MLVVKETPQIGNRPPKVLSGRGRRICDTRSPWKDKKETLWMSAGFLWNWNHSSAVCSIAKGTGFRNRCVVCSEVTGGLFTPQITSQWTLWSSMISVSWATNCFQVKCGLPRVWVVSHIWYSSLHLCICLLPNSSEFLTNRMLSVQRS